MTDNDRFLLDHAFTLFKDDRPEVHEDAEAFEYFCATQVMRPYDLDDDQIRDGLTRTESGSGGNDGGLDGVYGFINNILIQEDTTRTNFAKASELDIVLIQAKRSKGFEEAAVQSVRQSIDDLFNLKPSRTKLRLRYNENVRDKFSRFRRFLQLNPTISVSVYFVSRGDLVSKNVEQLADNLELALKQHFSWATLQPHFITADRLLAIMRQPLETTWTLPFVGVASAPEDNGHLAYVRLSDFYTMITAEDGTLRRQMFEANVRDYQGNNEVNRAIRASLESDIEEDFWALNNGVTIVVDKMLRRTSELVLTNPRIVNGLQTSKEIHSYFSGAESEASDERLLVARIVQPRSSEGRDSIILSTNSQTKIPIANLRATDPFQSKIEAAFLAHDYFYDRRKNFYKNLGRKASRIIPVLFLAQSITSIILQHPSAARARPSTLLKNDREYKRIFNPERTFETYLSCALVLRQAQRAISASSYPRKTKNNVRFHVAMYYALVKCGVPRIASMLLKDFESVDSELMQESISSVADAFGSMTKRAARKTEDQIGKSPDFDDAVSRLVKARLRKEA